MTVFIFFLHRKSRAGSQKMTSTDLPRIPLPTMLVPLLKDSWSQRLLSTSAVLKDQKRAVPMAPWTKCACIPQDTGAPGQPQCRSTRTSGWYIGGKWVGDSTGFLLQGPCLSKSPVCIYPADATFSQKTSPQNSGSKLLEFSVMQPAYCGTRAVASPPLS